MQNEIFAYDFDGVISIGITPHSLRDVIITGRCIDEQLEVYDYLKENNIINKVYFNPITLKERGNHSKKSRKISGFHKVNTIKYLKNNGIKITRFFEDDKIQKKIIQNNIQDLTIILIKSNLTQK